MRRLHLHERQGGRALPGNVAANLKAGLEASGRGWDASDRMIEMKVSFDTDRERAVADTKHWAALALSPEEKMSVEDPLEMERLAGALPVERTAKRWIVSTDPHEHVEKIRPYVEMGFRHLVFHAPGARSGALPSPVFREGS